MRARILVMTLLAAATAALTGACTTERSTPSTAAATTQPAMAAVLPEKSGAQLWTDNCRRCHNLRGPATFSPAQWEVVVHHMRLRANLTGEEARKVTAFLKSAS